MKARAHTHLMIVPLNDLQEQRWPILHRLAEDLQQIAVLVVVDENFQLLQLHRKHNRLNFQPNVRAPDPCLR